MSPLKWLTADVVSRPTWLLQFKFRLLYHSLPQHWEKHTVGRPGSAGRPMIPGLRRRQECLEFKASLSYLEPVKENKAWGCSSTVECAPGVHKTGLHPQHWGTYKFPKPHATVGAINLTKLVTYYPARSCQYGPYSILQRSNWRIAQNRASQPS